MERDEDDRRSGEETPYSRWNLHQVDLHPLTTVGHSNTTTGDVAKSPNTPGSPVTIRGSQSLL